MKANYLELDAAWAGGDWKGQLRFRSWNESKEEMSACPLIGVQKVAVIVMRRGRRRVPKTAEVSCYTTKKLTSGDPLRDQPRRCFAGEILP